MKLYFDIDGVLVGQGWQPAKHVAGFLKAATENHDCYWLTTHCHDGDSAEVIRYLKDILPSEAFEHCYKIKPTKWSFQKTNAIDFSSDFLWFDDDPTEIEKEILSKNNKLGSL